MKKMILITLILTAFSVNTASAQSVKSRRSYGSFPDFVMEVKKTIVSKRLHKVGTQEDMIIEPDQAVLLELENNPAQVKEFIIFYSEQENAVHLIYRYTDDTENDYQGTTLIPEYTMSYRGTRSEEATTWLWLFYEYEPKGGKALVKFRTTLSLSETDQQQIKKIKELRERRKAGNTIEAVVAKLREKVSKQIDYKFGTVAEVTIAPDTEAVLLKCSENAEDVKEILIGAKSNVLYIYCVRNSGSISGGGSSLGRSKGSFRQVGGSAAIGMWDIEDEKFNVTIQLTDEENAIVQSYKELEKRGRFSRMIKSWDVLVSDLELIFPRLTAEQRVEGFSRVWSMVKFNFANFDLVPELNWDDVLTEYLPKVMADQSNDQFDLLLRQCFARLKDGHTSVGVSGASSLPSASPPLKVRPIAGKAVVTEIVETEDVKASGIKPGDEITHIDGREVREVLEKDIYPYICSSTPQGRDLRAYYRLLRGEKDSKVTLSIKTLEGATRKVTLKRQAGGLSMLPRKNKEKLQYRDLGDGIAYVAINTFGTRQVVDAFEEHFNKISKAKGLIIDVRLNGGGSSSNGAAIIGCLIDEAIADTLWKTPQYVASFQAWGRPKKWYEGEPDMIEPREGEKYLGPIVILIGTQTFSAAEDFVVPLHAASRVTVVGQKSGGSTGQPLQFSFVDGKIRGRVCTKRDTYPDGREFVGVGIIPDVQVNPTPADIVAGRDVVLEKAIDILKSEQL